MQALRPVLAGQDRPLIIVATEPMASIFRSVCSYPHLAPDTISLSADDAPDHELAAAARPVLDELYAEEMEQGHAVYAERARAEARRADVAQAARAATFGAVDTLIIDMDADLPGLVDEETGAVTFDETADAVNYDVTDEIARRAWASGARIVAARRADVPGGAALAAILPIAKHQSHQRPDGHHHSLTNLSNEDGGIAHADRNGDQHGGLPQHRRPAHLHHLRDRPAGRHIEWQSRPGDKCLFRGRGGEICSASATFVPAVQTKKLYLSEPGQGLDRVDPVATGDRPPPTP